MHTTRLRQAANFPPLKLVEPGREERATRVDTHHQPDSTRHVDDMRRPLLKPAGSPGNQTGDPPLFDNEVHVPDI